MLLAPSSTTAPSALAPPYCSRRGGRNRQGLSRLLQTLVYYGTPKVEESVPEKRNDYTLPIKASSKKKTGAQFADTLKLKLQ